MKQIMTLLALVAVNAIAAVAVIQAKHESRGLQGELQTLRVERDQLTTEWAQLQLEESAWANPDRVAKVARERLDMTHPQHYSVLGVNR